LALLLFGIYMLTFDGTLHSTDGLSMFAVAENLVKHGQLDTRQLENWENVFLGPDGHPYTNFAFGPTLFMAPFLALALVLPDFGLTQTTMILMPLTSALTMSYLYLSARRLGYPAQTGLVVTLLAGLATTIWVRTRDLVADPLILLGFTAAFYYALAYRQDRKWSQAGLMGLALGLAVLHKAVNLVIAPLFFWYLAGFDFKPSQALQQLIRLRQNWSPLAIAASTLAACLLIIGVYNAIRFDNPLDTGYPSLFTTPVWIGLAGYIVSPYKSLFLYIPLFILIPFTIAKTWPKHPHETALILTSLLIQMMVFSAWYDWGGGRNWGPRFLVPMNGLLILLLLPFIHQALQPGHWPQRLILMVFGLTSLSMQILGISARDNVFLGAADYWTPPPNLSLWGELNWDNPAQWPIWGHLLLFNPERIPVIWRWQWGQLNYFDLPAFLAALLIVFIGLSGMIIILRGGHPLFSGRGSFISAWLVALAFVGVILFRSYPDPRSIKEPDETTDLEPAYTTLISQLPKWVRPNDTLIFTDRRFEFYLLDADKSPAQRYVLAKPTQPLILETIPKLLQEQVAQQGRIWLVTDDLDNRQLAYATELWLKQRGRLIEHHLFGDRVQLVAFEPSASAPWSAIPSEPPIAVVVNPDDHTFKGIASLLGWDWPGLQVASSPILQTGRAYDFELYWIYRGKAPQDRFFVRLLDQAGQAVVEVLTTPRPDERLIPGQLLIEDAILTLPAQLTPGTYTLQIGFTIPVVETGELVFSLPAELTEVRITR
jgi:hypothetical protein